ncbi:MAG: Gfo/Idh/MocA family oxidoreductase [Planctomycetes bacterium]|nr:Gfo/Idh/MocA family oxidoreductase [Planctomycetota bacterium]MBL7039580.1 Gfo/Idh/MocA family oxidoreductase [Pirellulaceae bacterium]
MKVNRRKFLGSAAVTVAATTIVPRHVLGGPEFVPPSEKVNVALVGAGGQGRSNTRLLFREKDAQVMAVADPFEHHNLDAFYYRGEGGRKPVKAEIEKHYGETTPNYRCADYEDFRVMLEKEKAIDAILCATPDHLHAYVSVVAMRAGKHVYCEKPLTHNVWEARQVAKIAKETGVATQMGNQGHSRDGIRQTCEWIWDGVIGPVHEAHAWVNAGRWNKHLTTRPTETPPVPAGVNWDMWLGPREPRPYHPAYTPVTWRDFWAFGSGALGDFGCHDLDAPMWALDLAEPTSIEARPAGNMDAEIAPHGEICYYRFGARGDKPPVNVTWYDGGLKPPCPEEIPEGSSLPGRGVLFIGEKGSMLCDGAGGACRLLPYEKTPTYERPAETIPRSEGHHRDWLAACKGGPPASSNFEYGAKLAELVLLGIASLRTGKKLHWDAANMKARGLPAADAIIKEQYRKGWEIA